MSPRCCALAVLSVVALFASSSIMSCGVMFGAEEQDFCAEPSCTLASHCPVTSCLCDDGTARSASTCLADKGCCAKTSLICEQLCEPHGGWSGQTDAGSGGSSGSAGRGGASGSAGAAGSAGSGGSGGSAGRAMLGQSCSGRSVSCGCTDPSDAFCNHVFRCSLPGTPSGTRVEGTECGAQVRCLMNSIRSTAGCGTTDFYLPYAVVGASCLAADTFACSLDLRSELVCLNRVWAVQESCSDTCGILRSGEPLCPSSTTSTFCVGCI
jgi:hypothetical protein